jgi:hypothetical protein
VVRKGTGAHVSPANNWDQMQWIHTPLFHLLNLKQNTKGLKTGILMSMPKGASVTNEYRWCHLGACHEGTQNGSVGMAPLILNFGTIWSWMVDLTPQTLHLQRKSPTTHWIKGLGPQWGLDIFKTTDKNRAPCRTQTMIPLTSSPQCSHVGPGQFSFRERSVVNIRSISG